MKKEYIELIENNPVSFWTVNLDWRPNVIWTAYLKVIWDNQILITDNYMKQTKENLENNNNICLAVWDNEWNWLKIIWTAEYFTEWKWKIFVENMEENNWLSAKWAIVIDIEEIIELS